MDSIKMANTGNSLVFPLLSLCLRNGVRARTVQRNWEMQEHQEDLVWVWVWVRVWLKRMWDLSAWSWAEEEEKQSRLFQADRHPGWGGGEGRQAAQRKEVNKRVLKELLPIHCTEKKKSFAAFRISIFYHLIAKLGLRMLARGCADQAAAVEKTGWRRAPWSG